MGPMAVRYNTSAKLSIGDRVAISRDSENIRICSICHVCGIREELYHRREENPTYVQKGEMFRRCTRENQHSLVKVADEERAPSFPMGDGRHHIDDNVSIWGRYFNIAQILA